VGREGAAALAGLEVQLGRERVGRRALAGVEKGGGNGSRGVKTALADEDLIRSPSVVDYRSHQR
jgi:hypothetical protein